MQGGRELSSPIVLIDGYNLMSAMIDEGLRGGDLGDFRHKMLLRLNQYRQQTGKYRVWVVFDGRRTRGERKFRKAGGVRVFFSEPPSDADTLIVELCQSNIGNVVLITSDRELERRTRGYVIRQIGSYDFLHNYLLTSRDLEEPLATSS